MLVKETLEKNGYRVLQADDGRDAEEIFSRIGGEKIDMLITDLVMPRVNGLDLAKELRKRKTKLKVLLISGYAEDPAHLRESRNLGYSYLAKPFSPETLLHQVRFLLDEPGELLLAHS